MEYYEITSLYVKREYQRMKIGHHLLSFVESQTVNNDYIIIKVLKNAYNLKEKVILLAGRMEKFKRISDSRLT